MVKMKKADLTKRLIAESLEKCLKTKRLEKISVTEIMRMANMTRQMFYHYFQDINALIYWIHLQRIEAYTEEFYESKDFVEAFGNALEEMYRYKEFYKNIITYEGYPSFSDLLFDQMYSETIIHIGEKRITEDLKFAMRMYWHGVTDMMIEWIRSDMKIKPRVLVQYFYDNLPRTLIRYYEK